MKLLHLALIVLGATIGSGISTVVNDFTGIAILFWAIGMGGLVAMVPLAYWEARKRAVRDKEAE